MLLPEVQGQGHPRSLNKQPQESHLSHVHHSALDKITELGESVLDASTLQQLLKDEIRGQRSIPSMFSKANNQATEVALWQLAWFVLDGIPFATADSTRFEEWCHTSPTYAVSTRHMMRNLGVLRNAVDDIIAKQLALLPFVSAAVDEWSSAILTSYLSISLQGYTDEFALIKVEDLVEFPPPHDAAQYRRVIKQRIDNRTTLLEQC